MKKRTGCQSAEHGQLFCDSCRNYFAYLEVSEECPSKRQDEFEYYCPVCGQQTDFEDDLCDDCGDKWDKYQAECEAFGINPTKEGFTFEGNDPAIWDHLI